MGDDALRQHEASTLRGAGGPRDRRHGPTSAGTARATRTRSFATTSSASTSSPTAWAATPRARSRATRPSTRSTAWSSAGSGRSTRLRAARRGAGARRVPAHRGRDPGGDVHGLRDRRARSRQERDGHDHQRGARARRLARHRAGRRQPHLPDPRRPGGADHRGSHAHRVAGQAGPHLAPDEAKTSPHRNVITRAVGNRDYVEVDTAVISVEPGDRYLLCSDGLHGYFEDRGDPGRSPSSAARLPSSGSSSSRTVAAGKTTSRRCSSRCCEAPRGVMRLRSSVLLTLSIDV